MLNYFKPILILIFITNIISCGIKDRDETQVQEVKEKNSITNPESNQIDSENIDATNTKDTASIKPTNKPIEWRKRIIRKKDGTVVYDSIAVAVETPKKSTKENIDIEKSTSLLKVILENTEVGETITQDELITDFKAPKDAAKLIKTITKTSEDELFIKWGSTWMAEKVSDAKFKDGKIKLKFKGNSMYTSGNAIGIKYEKKVYTDLIVTGKKTRIPGVKGYYWEIGK
ncbi:MAG TPA: hypothetical protein VN192_05375 [Flavobacterium sp.]|nr:hypothetical protein [Flavobacterium sp.]